MRSTVSGENTRMLPARASSLMPRVLTAYRTLGSFPMLAGYGYDHQFGLLIHSVSSQHRRPLCGATHVALANGLTYAGAYAALMRAHAMLTRTLSPRVLRSSARL